MATQQLQPGEKLYRIGVNHDCPVHQVFVGGHCFPRHSEKVSGYGSETQRDRVRGAVVCLTEKGLAACIKSAKSKVIRQTKGRKSRARIHDIRSKNFRPMTGDAEVLSFLYAVPMETTENPFEGASYPSLAKTKGALTPEAKAAEAKVSSLEAGAGGAAIPAKPRRKKRETSKTAAVPTPVPALSSAREAPALEGETPKE